MSRYLLCLFVVAAVAACHAQKTPELHVLGARHEVVYVQVTNPASHPMRLEKLEYKFAADNGKTIVARGELTLDAREVPEQSAVVVEVPLDAETTKPMVLTGTLTAELDEIMRSFQVSAQIQPH